MSNLFTTIGGRRTLRALLALVFVCACGSGAVDTAQGDPLLAAAGDIACAPGSTVDAADCRQAGTADLIVSMAPTAVAALGDNQYDSGTLTEFTGAGAFDSTWGRFKSLIHPTPGNHEYDLSSTASGYFSYFGTAAGDPSQGYYSYDLGNWHVVSLNSGCSDTVCENSAAGEVTTAETQWLQSDLAAHSGMCTLAYWHHPLFTSGEEGSSPGVAPLWEKLYSARADIVLNGHDHDYERFARQDPSGHATSDGIREFVVGTGGKSHFPFPATFVANSQFHNDTDFGALFLTLHPGSYDWAFRREDGTVLDSGSTACHYLPPTVSTDSANQVGQSTATLNGTVDPNALATTYHFDWGTSASYGHSVPATDASVGSDSSGHVESQALAGLSPSTTYHFRIVATNSSGTTYGADNTFTTQPPPPSATTEDASSVGQTSATLNGEVNPDGAPTTYHFEWGTAASYGHTVPATDASVGSDGSSHSEAQPLTGLSPSTTYHFRIVATSSAGTTFGSDRTLQTLAAPPPPPPPTAVTNAANTVGQTTATLNGTVNPQGQATSYRFDWGPTSGYGQSTPAQNAGSGAVDQAVAASLSSLTPATTYHFRVVASSVGGTAYGLDQIFTTQSIPPPTETTPPPAGTDVAPGNAPAAPAQSVSVLPVASPFVAPLAPLPVFTGSVRVPASILIRRLVRSGLGLSVTCSTPCALVASVRGRHTGGANHSDERRLASGRIVLPSAGTRSFHLQLSRWAKLKLSRVRHTNLTLRVSLFNSTRRQDVVRRISALSG